MTRRVYGPMQEDELEPLAEILANCFGIPPDGVGPWLEVAGHDNVRMLRDEGRPVAALILIEMGQYFGGERVPMVGIAGVGVPPRERGKGTATRLMKHCVRELAKRAAPLSALYPATHALYRRAGYEVAGGRYATHTRPDDLAVSERGVVLRPLEERDEARVRAIYARHARLRDGWLDRGPYSWGRTRRTWEGKPTYGLGVEVAGKLEGYVVYRQRAGDEGLYQLRVTDLAYASPAAGRRLLGALADHWTMAYDLVFPLAPWDPLFSLLPEPKLSAKRVFPWMLRLADVHAALGGRGYRPGVEARLDLSVRDDVVRKNQRRFVLEVSDGVAHVREGGRGTLELDVRALASLYAGYETAEQLAASGRLSATRKAAATATTVFSGSAPTMPDHF